MSTRTLILFNKSMGSVQVKSEWISNELAKLSKAIWFSRELGEINTAEYRAYLGAVKRARLANAHTVAATKQDWVRKYVEKQEQKKQKKISSEMEARKSKEVRTGQVGQEDEIKSGSEDYWIVTETGIERRNGVS